eukprot:jgi/Pico_ML_1/54872/g728.t1
MVAELCALTFMIDKFLGEEREFTQAADSDYTNFRVHLLRITKPVDDKPFVAVVPKTKNLMADASDKYNVLGNNFRRTNRVNVALELLDTMTKS